MARERWKKLNDLFIRGEHVDLPDGSHLWVQVLNTYERDDAVNAAQVARSRLIMALRDKGDERTKVMAHIAEVGYDEIARELADVKVEDSYFRSANQVRDDPEWKERIEILDKTNDGDPNLSQEERDLIDKLQVEFMEELERRRAEELELAQHEYQMMEDTELEEAYLEVWLDKRAGMAAAKVHTQHEVAFAARYCDEEGEVEKNRCSSVGPRIFEDPDEVRNIPEELQNIIRAALVRLTMSERDPKVSGSLPASSASSPTPSAPAESTPSTSTATPPTAPGTSSPQSATV